MSESNGHSSTIPQGTFFSANVGSIPAVARADRFSPRELHAVLNALTLRQEMLRGSSPDRRRNVYDECGWPRPGQEAVQHYWDLYARDSVAARIIEYASRQSWKVQPSIYETEDEEVTPFEEAWDALGQSLRGNLGFFQDPERSPIWEYLLRADVMSGIGRYGIVLLGLDDGKPLSAPVRGVMEKFSQGVRTGESSAGQGTERQYGPYTFSVNAELTKGRRLLYLRVFPEAQADVTVWEGNPSSPRYGHPVMYSVTFNDPRESTGGIGQPLSTREVHWTRVVHVADVHHTSSSHESLAVPRLRPMLNEVLGLQLMAGAVPEGFWKSAFTMLSLESQFGDVELDIPAMRDMMERVRNGLQRDLFLGGAKANPINVTAEDPTPGKDYLLERIAMKLGAPKRKLLGSERGELASSQDDGEDNDRIRERNQSYVTPRIIAPFTDRLIMVGVLPEPTYTGDGRDRPGYSVDWPDLSEASAMEKADVLTKRTQAFAAYVGGNVGQLIPPEDYLTREAGFTAEEADAIQEKAEAFSAEQDELEMEKQAAMIDEGLVADPVAESEAKVEALKAKASQPAPAFGKPTSANVPLRKPAPTGNADLDAALEATYNAFCATGPGGGIDPTCSPENTGAGGGGSSPNTDQLARANDLERLHPGVTVRKDDAGKEWVVKGRVGRGKQASNEATASELGGIAGVDVVRVHHVKLDGQDASVSERVKGTPLVKMDEAGRRAALASVPRADLDKHALLDYVIGSHDPNDGNYFVKDGKMVALDKEMSLGQGLGNRSHFQVPFMLGYATPKGTPASSYEFSSDSIKGMAELGAKVAEHLRKKGKTRDAEGVERRTAVLSELAKSGRPVTAAEIDAAGTEYDRRNPPAGPVKRFFKGLFGGR